jgi:glucose-1-phosphate adenylyltransferase
MRKTVAIVFAGGCVDEMSVLTFRRPKSAVVFGGAYRMIDFALTNLSNTQAIRNVGILTQYRPSSLVDHIGSGLAWDYVGACRGIHILPPYIGHGKSEWYRGTADALYQNLDFLDIHKPDDILIISGDHAYTMDYEPLLRFHIEHDADVTMAFTPVKDNPSRFGIAEINSQGKIVSYMEKPEHPRTNFASMTVYVFKREVLVEELRAHASVSDKPKSFQIYDDILPGLIERRRAFGWIHHGTWEYARTLDEYYKAHQEMLGCSPRINITEWNVRTNDLARRVAPPAPVLHCPGATIVDSMICGGCKIEGHVERSILSPDVIVKKGAVVRNSILWEGVVVEEGAVCDMVISDKRTIIGKNTHVGHGNDMTPNNEQPASLTAGMTVLGMDVRIPEGLILGRNCIVYPRAGEKELGNTMISSGSTIQAEM